MTLTQITEKGIKDGEIVNADINASAAIAKSKLASLDIVNADVNGSAAIAGSKISPDFGSQNIVTTGSITGNDLEINSGTLSVDASNNRVGIGTTSPSYPLDVIGDGGISVAPSTNSTVGQLSIVGKNSAGGVSAISRIKSNPDGSSNQSHLSIETRNSSSTMVEAMRITSDQKVGIGTTSPGGKLAVFDSSSAVFRLETPGVIAIAHSFDGTDYTIANNDGSNGHPIIFGSKTSGGESMRIDSSGVLTVGSGANTATQRAAFLGGYTSFENSAGSGNPSITFNNDIDTGFLNPSGNTIAVNTGGSERMRIDDQGRLGIGTTSPTSLLHLSATNPVFQLTGTSAGNCVLQTDGADLTLNVDSGNSNTSSALAFRVDNSEKMRIDSSGNILCVANGDQSSLAPFFISVIGKNAINYGGGTNDTACLRIEDKGTNNSYYHGIELRTKRGGDVRMYAHDQGDDTADLVFALDNGNSPAERVRMLNTGGITFNGDTAAANALDDYEEGTYTITPLNDGGATLTSNRANYTKIGNMVRISGSFTITATNGTNNNQARFSLPFTSSVNSYYVAHGNTITSTGYTGVVLSATIENSAPYMIFNPSVGMASRSWSQLGNNRFDFDIVYRV